MESEPMPSSLAVLASPRRRLLDVHTLDSEALTSLSAANIQLVASQTGLEQLLCLAHRHVDNVMAQHADEAVDSDGEGYAMLATPEKKKIPIAVTLSRIVSNAIRTLRRNARGEVGGSGAFMLLAAAEVGEARYKRLKAGFTRLQEHVNDVAEHREQLLRELDQLRADTTTLQETSMSLMKPSASSSADISANLSRSCAAIEKMKNVLEQEVAEQTSRKLAELQIFEKKLHERELLRYKVDVAEKQLQAKRAGILNRGHRAKKKRVTTMREIAAKRQEFQHLRRRLAVMTEALEHVFQFHFQLDQCIVEPELETVRNQIQRFFQQNQRAFEALQPKL